MINPEKRIEELEQQVKSLQKAVGSWKRKAKEQSPRPEFLRERHSGYRHYIDVILRDLPEDATLNETLQHIRTEILPVFFPYEYSSCFRTKKYGWVVTLEVDFQVDMAYHPDRNTN